MEKRLTKALSIALFGALMASGTLAAAAGFAIIENSAQGQGDAFASGGAAAEEAASMWFNPATLSKLGSQMQTSISYINPSFEFTDKGSVQNTPFGPIPLLPSAGSVEDGGKDALVPNFYYTRKINDKVSFGLAINAPFGLRTGYDPQWKGRYQAVDSRILDFNVNPAIAYKVNDNLTFGAGVSANYIDARLTNTIDFTAVCLSKGGGATCTGAAAGPGNGGNDGFVENKADDLSFGFNFGLLYEINDNTRVSAAYRSQINHKLDGKARFSTPATISTVGGAPTPLDAGIRSAFTNDGIEVGLSLPDSFSFSGYHRMTPKIAVLADATWTGWSDIPELRIIFDRPTTAGGPGVETLGWQDTWRLALGLHFYQSERLTFRTGVAYDESPTPGAVLRTARLPDNDRIWLSFGASYKINNKMSADLGYSHLFISDTNIARTSSSGSTTLNGTYESNANILSAQFNYQFN